MIKQDVDIPPLAGHKTRPRHPIDLENAKLPPELAKSRYGKWRALSLILVYVAMIAHIAHWQVKGQTMAPLELSEIMKALELGVVSPGVIFIGLMLLGSAVLGRFFCSWGCHMLALQDLSHWILKKLRIRPITVRSRVLLLVPFLTAGYMFFWPQIKRLSEGRELPEASARLVTTNFWRDLPGPLVIALTALTCGFLIVYLFGGRGFCTYGCPYGVLFGFMDRIAPGKIRAAGGCEQCGRCTAICTSGVRVHEEVRAYGMVVNPRCMKDLDCVSVCPNNALQYGFGRPTIGRPRAIAGYGLSILEELALVALFVLALFTWGGLLGNAPILVNLALSAATAYLAIVLARLVRRPTNARPRDDHLPAVQYDFSLPEEIAMLAVFGLALFTWRGLYDRLPFLMSIAASAITAYIVITCIRLLRRPQLKLNRHQLKANGRLTRAGRVFAVISTGFLVFAGHSCFIQYHKWRGDRLFAAADAVQGRTAAARTARRRAMEDSAAHLQACYRYGLFSTTNLEFKLGTLMLGLDRPDQAEDYLKRAVDRSPMYPEARIKLAEALESGGKPREATNNLFYALELYSPHEEYQPRYRHLYALAQVRLGRLLVQQALLQLDPIVRQARMETAKQHYNTALELEDNAEAHVGLGFLSAYRGPDGLEGAAEHYRTAIQLDPQAAEAYANLGDVHVALGDAEQAAGRQEQFVAHYEQAISRYRQGLEIDHQLEKIHFKLGYLNLQLSKLPAALEYLAIAAQRAPRDAGVRKRYGQALLLSGRPREAREQFRKANEHLRTDQPG
jgi:tetratricopeptide (TPR) repeat protein/polyferredoxin